MEVNNTTVRYGNLVYPMHSPTGVKLPMYGFPVKVFEAHFEGAKVAFKFGEPFATQSEIPFYGYSMLCGIQLDEVWLTAFGFVNDKGTNVWKLPRKAAIFPFELEHKKGEFCVWVKYNGKDLNPISYVHQLQNLFFGVTQKELNFDLPYLHSAGVGKLKGVITF